ncbi:MAG: Transglutaminase [Frankiales bacterium]|nr:Transglutaminase [Frankiales bacterium]
MTSLLDAPVDVVDHEEPDLDHLDRLSDDPDGSPEQQQDAVAPAALGLAVVSGALSSAAAAWMIGGVFRGLEGRLVGLLGVLIGAGLVAAATRLRSAVLQYLVLPVALLVGAVLMSSASGAGTSSLPALVKDAATSSQVLQPPIDFAPGWRLIIVVVLALLSSSACALALSSGRPRVAVAVPAPLTLLAALVQPTGTAVTTSAVSVGLVMMALATSYAADGVGESFDVRFEVRRLLRSLLVGVLLVAGLIAASKVSFLFPEQDSNRIVPPRRPPVSPPQPDVPLYTVRGDLPGPLRVGVIDVYDLTEQAWFLPPVDNQRLVRLELPADLPSAPTAAGPSRTVSVTVQQAEGRLLPVVAGAQRIEGDETVDLDPRTEGLALAQRPVFTGLRYDVVTGPAPTGTQLSAVDLVVPDALREQLQAPPVPPAVEALLRDAPEAPYARLQTLRTKLYSTFTAAGAGQPTDVSPDRVVELLAGGTGNPYELTASEALLARWAGVPARIAVGYSGGRELDDGSVELRPSQAVTYLEAWFGELGWVAVVGTPPRAQQSLTNNSRNQDSSIQASPDLGINVFLPVVRPNRLALYEYARYYLVRTLPFVALAGLLLLIYPVVLKRLRRRRRAAWAAAHGPVGAVVIAYCALRDGIVDLALPGRDRTPLELVEVVAEDEEHAELAWLVTRGLWGDLRGRLTEDDAATAQRLADSVASRMVKAQPETARLLAAVSRASLRAPWTAEVPNVWWQPRLRGRVPSPAAGVRALRRRVRRGIQPGFATSLVVVVALLTLSGCSSDGSVAEPTVAFPTRLAPTSVAGLQTRVEDKAAEEYAKGAKDRDVIVSEGKVVSFSRGGLVQAALQVAQLKPGYLSSDAEVVDAIARSVGDVDELRAQGDHELFTLTEGTQRIYLWFPTVKSMALLVVRTQVTTGAAEALARQLIDYGDGGEIDDAALQAAFTDTADSGSSAIPGPTVGPTVSPSPAGSPGPTDTSSTAPTPEPSR